MKSFSPQFLKSVQLPLGTSWLLGACMEAKGQQEFWEQRRPETLAALKDLAKIQSAESSNRIEGIEVESQRLKPLVLGKTKPRSRPEEEVMGYRYALEFIHKKHSDLIMDSKTIKDLHSLAQDGAGDAGQWKKKDNEIIEFDQKGQRSVRFVPSQAKDTPTAIKDLCAAYENEMQSAGLPPLITASLFVLDFLCIHPFRDGNGRVSRLLSLLCLYKLNFHVGKYVSLERIIEENKQSYYEALKQSSQGWHKQEHNPLPWINFFLSMLRQACKELSENMEMSQSEFSGKGEFIEKTILGQTGNFTLKELRLQCPHVSSQMIKKTLHDMKKNRRITLVGRGRGAYWKVV
jgi:Fic family protein